MANLLVNSTGYKTIKNGVAPTISTSQDIYVGIKNNSNIPVGIVRFNTTVGNVLGVPDATLWSQMRISKAVLTLKQRDSCPSSSYVIVLTAKNMTSGTNTEAAIYSGGHRSTGNKWASGTAGANQIVTFDLTSLFKTLPDSISFQPNVSPWYVFLYRTSGFASNYRYWRRANYESFITLEGGKKSGAAYWDGGTWQSCQVKYYVDSTTGWQDCEAKYWDGSAWIPVGAP